MVFDTRKAWRLTVLVVLIIAPKTSGRHTRFAQNHHCYADSPMRTKSSTNVLHADVDFDPHILITHMWKANADVLIPGRREFEEQAAMYEILKYRQPVKLEIGT